LNQGVGAGRAAQDWHGWGRASFLPELFYWVIAANAATYAMVGAVVEALRQMRRNSVQSARELSN
jgi:hypothetical protein